ncbi:hypothetical protein CDEST_03313 [Colletotrichum destructivum]|uniref:Secreted protein n=1 Tax=Colletotrichum destructivum TaxID=34406 RepID=A0AAX4I4V5_9PEZI|nr:hypothetical protein CDEST_03313 [Colletotrichum destructivum]
MLVGLCWLVTAITNLVAMMQETYQLRQPHDMNLVLRGMPLESTLPLPVFSPPSCRSSRGAAQLIFVLATAHCLPLVFQHLLATAICAADLSLLTMERHVLRSPEPSKRVHSPLIVINGPVRWCAYLAAAVTAAKTMRAPMHRPRCLYRRRSCWVANSSVNGRKTSSHGRSDPRASTVEVLQLHSLQRPVES